MIHYTTIEQSKRLLELGLSPESADMCYEQIMTDNHDVHYKNPQSASDVNVNDSTNIPCWSVGALRKLLPIGIKNEKGDTYLFSDHNRLDGTWVYQYATEKDTFVYFSGTDIEACFRIIVYLLENNYIKKEE